MKRPFIWPKTSLKPVSYTHLFLILLPEYLQQILSICAAVLGGIQQCHGLLRQHPALVQKRPKLLIVENMGRQEADIRIVGQVDQAGQRDGADVPSALDLEQAVQAHTVVLKMCIRDSHWASVPSAPGY